jgi:hypothetical protein
VSGELTPDELAQYRGCEPWNPCYGECLDAARYTLEHPSEDDEEELAYAASWARTQRWTSDER